MNTATKLSTYGLVLALVAGAGWVVGETVGPAANAETEQASGEQAGDLAEGGMAGHGEEPGADPAAADAEIPPGLASSAHGYTFVPGTTTFVAGAAVPFSFEVIGPDGHPVTKFDTEHEKKLHLIVLRRDTSGFQHVHPKMDADGTWTVNLDLGQAGSYRAFADFAPTDGESTTLGVDLSVPGSYEPKPFPASSESTVDGYKVVLDGELTAGSSSKVTLTLTKDGQPVSDLQPYLGAYGHLVALRQGDLAYLHVHPDGEPDDGKTEPGPEIAFYVEVPSAGTYRLFLDFQHNGTVRTAEFTLTTTAAGE